MLSNRLGFKSFFFFLSFSVPSLLPLDNQCADMVAAGAGGEGVAGAVVKIAREDDKFMIHGLCLYYISL